VQHVLQWTKTTKNANEDTTHLIKESSSGAHSVTTQCPH
jgi:hypothetical protein